MTMGRERTPRTPPGGTQAVWFHHGNIYGRRIVDPHPQGGLIMTVQYDGNHDAIVPRSFRLRPCLGQALRLPHAR